MGRESKASNRATTSPRSRSLLGVAAAIALAVALFIRGHLGRGVAIGAVS